MDVTLAVEGRFLRAHKMVLSACSPYFQTLFTEHPDKHPIVILKDVPYTDMRCLLDFMYRGEVSVNQDRLTAFLKVAETLRIKGNFLIFTPLFYNLVNVFLCVFLRIFSMIENFRFQFILISFKILFNDF